MVDVGWLYWTDREHGPVTLEDLTDLVRSGLVTATTDIRKETAVAWSNAKLALPALFDAPPAPGEKYSAAPRRGWTDLKSHPWRRYFARMLDSLVVGSVTGVLLGIVAFSTAPEPAQRFFAIFNGPMGNYLDQILTTLLVIPGNALMIGLTGVSFGKWVFGVRVLKDGKPLGFFNAIRREFGVWWFGMGAGVPFVSLLTLATSFNRLTHKGSTAWDKAQRITVVHRDRSLLANILMWMVGAGILAFNVGLKLLALAHH